MPVPVEMEVEVEVEVEVEAEVEADWWRVGVMARLPRLGLKGTYLLCCDVPTCQLPGCFCSLLRFLR